jgi:glutamyl/glutaminyl-tRNA synthetase
MQRLDRYTAAAQMLLAGDKAYFCYCTTEQLAADKAAQEACARGAPLRRPLFPPDHW